VTYLWRTSRSKLPLGAVVTEIVNPTKVLEMLGGLTRYRRFVLDGIREGHNDEYYDLTDQRFLGAPEFVEEVKQSVPEQPTRNPDFSLAQGVELLASAIDLDPNFLRSPGRNRKLSRARTIVESIPFLVENRIRLDFHKVRFTPLVGQFFG